MGHEPVAEVEQAVEVVAPREDEHHGESDGRTHRRRSDPGDDAGRYPADHVPRERVDVGAAGEVLELDRFPERERRAELQEGKDRLHIDSL